MLFVLKGLLGDSVMCTPVLPTARKAWPSARFVLLGQSPNCELLSGCPFLDEYRATFAGTYSLSHRKELEELRKWLAGSGFDLAIILLGDDFAALLSEAGIPVRVGVQGTLLEPCLTHVYPCASPRTWGPSDRLNALRVLGFKVPDQEPVLWTSDAARETARAKLVESGKRAGEEYAVVHPFGSQKRQWWPLDRVERLALAIKEMFGLSSVVVGGESEKQLASNWGGKGIKDLSGKLNLQELLATIESAAVVISTDSGPFHMAGALGRPLVGLFRRSRPEHSRRYGARTILGTHPSCGGNCRWDRCRYSPCLEMQCISVEQVLEELQKLHRDKSKTPEDLSR